MEGLNTWYGLGNLGADPDLRVTQGGMTLLKLRLACSESYQDQSGARQERTEWVSITVFGKRAEGLGRILHKGDRITVTGRLSTSSYEKDGEKRYRTEIIADKVILNGDGRAHEKSDGKGYNDPNRSVSTELRSRNANPRGGGGGAGPAFGEPDDVMDVPDIDDVPFIHQGRLGRGRP